MVVLGIFTVNITVSPSKDILGFSGFYSQKAMSMNWCGISLSANETYLYLHRLKEICGLVEHYAYHILRNLWLMYEPHWTILFALNLKNLDIPSAISSSGNTFGMKLGSREVSLVSLLLNHFHWNILAVVFYHFQFGYVGLDCQSSSDQLNHHMVQSLFCFYLQHPGLLSLAVYVDTMLET